MKYIVFALMVGLFTLTGCAMFTAWKSIPPPGGCDQCHTTEIAENWQVNYKAVQLSSESGKLPFQTPQYNAPARVSKPASVLDLHKTEDQPCFECHTAPTPAHRERKGRYHH